MSFSSSAFSLDAFDEDAFSFLAPLPEAFSDTSFDKDAFDENSFAFGDGTIPPILTSILDYIVTFRRRRR